MHIFVSLLFSIDSLNTNQFERETPPAYDAVLHRRPRVYTYAPSRKEIPREEEVLDEEESESSTLNEVHAFLFIRMVFFVSTWIFLTFGQISS